VCERYETEILLLTHKIAHKNCPSYLTDFVALASDTSVRTTRAHKFVLRTPGVGVDAAENLFVVKSSRLCNNLPEKIVFQLKYQLVESYNPINNVFSSLYTFC